MTALVMGASGFLGSHVTRQLTLRGDDVRVLLRRTSDTRGIDDLDVQRCYGDLFDDDGLRAAMTGVDVLYYCVVDARAWLRDPGALFSTNVEGLRRVLDMAVATGIGKFVFTSTVGTLAAGTDRPVTEEDEADWTGGGPYIESRRAAEALVLEYARTRGLPAVAMCVSTTYGPGDWQPTPHGGALAMVAAGRFPFYFGYSLEVVGIEDAARAMLLAAEKGRIGERYIISDRFMSSQELHAVAAEAGGVRAPRIGIPLPVLYAGARINDLAARMVNRDLPFATAGMRIVENMGRLDHSKAVRELGWRPEPVRDSIQRAVQFFADQRR
ncbi:NAD-dependent epimerase/dehydratase family protein [Mycolicibacterium bacteremicum]|uniref:NAD-dependent epimerase/dehydratase family protein n=1 Tax=Mycolicibacterium bacteremicum TaxID=564198 RepID=UPI0026F1E43B|nr:NAD-dependent epimerase/dehydratase family protein [Mycolicibacterium bacteremicum]